MADMTAEQLLALVHRYASQWRDCKNASAAVKGDDRMRDICECAMIQLHNIATHLDRLSGMAAVPDGWKLVPIEPTEVMLLEADSELMREPRIGMVRGRSPARVYRAMLAAAPEVPGHG